MCCGWPQRNLSQSLSASRWPQAIQSPELSKSSVTSSVPHFLISLSQPFALGTCSNSSVGILAFLQRIAGDGHIWSSDGSTLPIPHLSVTATGSLFVCFHLFRISVFFFFFFFFYGSSCF